METQNPPPTTQPQPPARVYTQQELNNYTNYLNTFNAQKTRNNPHSFSNNRKCRNNNSNIPYAMIGVGLLLFIIIKNKNI